MVKLSRAAALLAMLLALILTPIVLAQPGQPAPEQVEAAQAAIAWLVEQQNSDGGYTSFSAGRDQAPSDVGGTVDALLALTAAGADQVAGGEATPVGYLRDHPDELQSYAETNPGQAGKAVVALVAAGQEPGAFADIDLVTILRQQLAESATLDERTPIEVAYALLGLAAAGEPAPEGALDWLRARQATEGEFAGAWDDGFGTTGSVDATALALMALDASGAPGSEEAIASGIDFLRGAQLPSAEWPYAPGLAGNANSTALAIQALLALNEDVALQDGAWAQEGVTPMDALLSWQGSSGAFQADLGQGREDSFFATVQAVPALLLKPYPLATEVSEEPPGEEAAEPTTVAEAAAEGPSRAGLVVVLSEEEVVTQCVPFDEASISGQQLLERSGLSVETQVQGAGALTCSIEGTGCPADDCFCQCESGGEGCLYWSYWQQRDGEWQYAVTGAAQTEVTDGLVEGWVWGSGAEGEAPEPPAITFAEICSASSLAAADEPVAIAETEADEALADEAVTEEAAAVARPDWPTYALFIALVVAIGLVAWFVRRRSQRL